MSSAWRLGYDNEFSLFRWICSKAHKHWAVAPLQCLLFHHPLQIAQERARDATHEYFIVVLVVSHLGR